MFDTFIYKVVHDGLDIRICICVTFFYIYEHTVWHVCAIYMGSKLYTCGFCSLPHKVYILSLKKVDEKAGKLHRMLQTKRLANLNFHISHHTKSTQQFHKTSEDNQSLSKSY